MRTPTPWTVGGRNGNIVYGNDHSLPFSLVVAHCNHTGEVPPETDVANACFIARACNAHDEMLATLKAVRQWIDPNAPGSLFDRIDAVIAKAEGRSV